jgi:hypothetical protein
MSTLYLETTEVSVGKTVGDIVALLVQFGANSINTTYQGGKPSGLSWSMAIYGTVVYYALPVRVGPVYEVLRKKKPRFLNGTQTAALHAAAERIAWRQLLAWIKVQLAMVQLDMVEFAQVFLPYTQESPGGITAWEHFKGQKFPALESGKR